METLNCQNCKKDFQIESEDFDFYKKIKVPPPTFCPDCSHQRRFAWRNTHSLYKRRDYLNNKDIISIYSPEKELNVVDQKYWWSDSWDPMDYGREYDFSIPFFSQWKKLMEVVPLQGLSNSKAVNSEYCNVAEESYDCYMISASWKNERTMYSDSITQIKDSSDLYVVHRTEFSYDSMYCSDSYQLFYCENTYNTTDSYFLYDCKGCVNCFMSSNLRNKSYVWRNEQLSKEDYYKRIKSVNFGSYNSILELKKEFENLKIGSIHNFANILNSHNVSGDNIERGENSYYVFDATAGIKDSKYVFWSATNLVDVYNSGPGIGLGEQIYEVFDAGAGGGNIKFGNVVYYSSNIEYSFNCYNCKDCFGCHGLRNKQYCILNKQYTKDEFFSLVEKIKQHMDSMPYIGKDRCIYKYGEFFPIELSPFFYNETIAQLFFPLSQEEILEKGYSYKMKENKNYKTTVLTNDIPDQISDINDSITQEVITCLHPDPSFDRCSNAFKITPEELLFYKRFSIPLPRLCYQCRHYERFKKRNPLKLWYRQCMCEDASHKHDGICKNTFETSYSPKRIETIYCEECYQKEVL